MIEPVKVLVIYQDRSELNPNPDTFYVEVSDVDEKGHRRNTRPISKKEINKLAEMSYSYKKDVEKMGKGFSGMISKNIISFSNGLDPFVIWSNEPQTRIITSKILNKETNYTLNLPGVIYLLEEDSLSLWFHFDKEITPETKLYRPCIANGHNSVCMGGNKLPSLSENSFEDAIIQTEKTYWGSYFNNDSATVMKGGGNVYDYYKKIGKSPIREKDLKHVSELQSIL